MRGADTVSLDRVAEANPAIAPVLVRAIKRFGSARGAGRSFEYALPRGRWLGELVSDGIDPESACRILAEFEVQMRRLDEVNEAKRAAKEAARAALPALQKARRRERSSAAKCVQPPANQVRGGDALRDAACFVAEGSDLPATASYVYCFYSQRKTLLYVGVTDDTGGRIRQHSRDKEWWPLVARFHIVAFTSRAVAERREATLIRTAAPLFNVTHNVGRQFSMTDLARAIALSGAV